MEHQILDQFIQELNTSNDSSLVITKISRNLQQFIQFPNFYSIPISNMIQILSFADEPLNQKQSIQLLDESLRRHGIAALQLIPYLTCDLNSLIQPHKSSSCKISHQNPSSIQSKNYSPIRVKSNESNESQKPNPPIPRKRKKVTKINVPHYMQDPKQLSVDSLRMRKFAASSPNLLKVVSPNEQTQSKSPRKRNSINIPETSWAKNSKELSKEERENKMIAIFAAIDRNDLYCMKKIIDNDKSLIFLRSNQDETLLHMAMRRENIEMAKYLISNGLDVNSLNKYGSTPIFNSIYQGDFNGIEFLLMHGADLQAKNYNGNTPLHWAVDCHKPKVCSFLISKGANIDAQNNNGETPLFIACEQGLLEITKILLDHDADITLSNLSNETPKDVALHPDIQAMLTAIS